MLLVAAGCSKTSTTQTSEKNTIANDTAQKEIQKQAEEIYKNDKYGFRLTLTNAWKGYKLTESPNLFDDKAQSIIFNFPTVDQKSGTKFDLPILLISVVPKAEWESKYKNETGPLSPIFLAEKDGLVYSWNSTYTSNSNVPEANDYQNQVRPRDGKGKLVDFEIPRVVASFTFIK